jgi:hypothetical protein
MEIRGWAAQQDGRSGRIRAGNSNMRRGKQGLEQARVLPVAVSAELHETLRSFLQTAA